MVDLLAPRPRPRVSRVLAALCRRLGHSYAVRTYERGNENCDCGADHSYPGCVRCGEATDTRPWW